LVVQKKKDKWEYKRESLVGFLPENDLVKRVDRELQAKFDKDAGIVQT
jgi:hypothetical protein